MNQKTYKGELRLNRNPRHLCTSIVGRDVWYFDTDD